ncbi:Eco57I restriction-modification methylase domain-containing protein [Ruminococcus albus]|uniref:Eco57I restriction-modification methylase domain-containing protein n=1 Tax=Ruminococcus albus TaxID=1264 RepID=UPI0004644088|nr:Eco57I restriction-modification methylase domain-containing protein [Ruminococcus albus]
MTDSKRFESSFSYKLIYIFRINDDKHKDILKIGEATIKTDDSIDRLPPNCRQLNQAAKKRIDSYTNTAGVQYELLHTELAIRIENGSLKIFRDYDVHNVLTNSGIEKAIVKDTKAKEWFKVDLDTAIRAIEAVKQFRPTLNPSETGITFTPIVFRPEQLEAIKATIAEFKTGNRMLWNAKMRFGKTLSALEVIRKMKFGKTIIITHRPVVDSGWYEDYKKIFYHEDDFEYGSKSNGFTIEKLLKSGKNFIYFASIQDLRGSEQVGGKHIKNDIVFSTKWDCVIVDEAHEGTTTALGEEVINSIVTEDTKFLALSGTPFNILGNYDNNVYTWDYIMEQRRKAEWDNEHFGDSNPYEELPKMNIYVYDLGKLLGNRYVELEDKAFNFHEFFRVWTGDIRRDFKPVPEGSQIGDFVHADDVWSFLCLIAKEDEDSQYPYSSKEYRELFRHSLWMIPGVKEAKALKRMMKKHPVFGLFDVVNVAGDGDEEEKSDTALAKVRNAIKNAGNDGYTITLSCGKLTTGVTVKEWNAVFMLAGSFSTSAANYLQTIFRVQSPCNQNGKFKDNCYVFDFAPDRTLKMVAESVTLSTKAGKTTDSDRKIMGEFLNYCPVISIEGTTMRKYETNRLLQQLKRAYAERAVQNGFDDTNLYNDELLKLDDVDLQEFNKLKGIIGTSKAQQKTKEVDINKQGFTEEEYEELQKIDKKPKKERTPEEQAKLDELKEKKKNRNNAISILRGISIRMPLLIYGADIPIGEDFTLDKFLDDSIVDEASWTEFMPSGVTRDVFKQFMKYYDQDIFVAAGRKIRNTVMGADELAPTERVMQIAQLFACFKNPDKETVLTPWRVVNMHMSDCLGGYCFYEENPPVNAQMLEQPRFVDRGQVTAETFNNAKAHILEINSKTGLYPLYVVYSLFRARCSDYPEDELTLEKQNELWKQTVRENIFVICKTPMAKYITKRTLVGFRDIPVNAHYFDDLINTMQNKQKQFVDKVLKPSYWDRKGDKMTFDAVVGNPPYQATTSGGIGNGKAATQAKPIFQLFVQQAKVINPGYVSMIIPARWYNGGMGLNEFRKDMIDDKRMACLIDFYNARNCFPTVDIAGGICYFLWANNHDGDCEIVNKLENGAEDRLIRPLGEFGELIIRSNKAISIIKKVLNKAEGFWDKHVSALDTFGISSKEKGHPNYQPGDIQLLHSVGFNGQGIDYISPDVVTKNQELIQKYKIKISILIPQGGESGVQPENGYRSISGPQILPPGVVDTFSYLNVAFFDTEQEAKNFFGFLIGKFARFMLRTTFSSVHLSKNNFIFVPEMDFTQEWSDEKLYDYFGLDENEVEFIEKTMRVIEIDEN